MSARSEAMKPKRVRRSSGVMQQPLTTSNYKSKFSQLLASEESVHTETLRERSVYSEFIEKQLHVLYIYLSDTGVMESMRYL